MDQDRKSNRLMRPFLLERKAKLLRLVANGLGQAATTVGISLIVRDVFDSIGHGHRVSMFADASHIWMICGLLLLAITARAVLVFDQRAQAEALGQEFAHDTRLKVFSLVSRISPDQLQKRSRTNLILRLSNDVTPLRQWISNGLARSTVAVVSIVATLAALLIIDAYMALIVSVAIAAGVGFAFLLKSPFQNVLTDARKKRGELASGIGERVANMTTIMANRQVSRESRRVTQQSQAVVDAMVSRARYMGVLRAFGEGLGGLAMAGALMLGAWQVTEGLLTTGTLAAVLSIVRLMSRHFRDLERAYEYWHVARVAKRSLDRLLSLRVLSRPDSEHKAIPEGGSVSLDGVALGEMLATFTGSANAGEKVAIVGPPGSGKSTIFMLIMGLLDPDRGTITIGGADLKQTPRKLLPELMGIVSADFPLLRGSIRKNVFYRRNKASEEEFTFASQMSGLDQVLAKYPEGLETRLLPGGSNLSVSERQCIALARALMGLPPLLLIDETGLAADLETKKKIRSLMAEYPGTILLITYDDELKETATKLWEVGLTMPSAERSPASMPV